MFTLFRFDAEIDEQLGEITVVSFYTAIDSTSVSLTNEVRISLVF